MLKKLNLLLLVSALSSNLALAHDYPELVGTGAGSQEHTHEQGEKQGQSETKSETTQTDTGSSKTTEELLADRQNESDDNFKPDHRVSLGLLGLPDGNGEFLPHLSEATLRFYNLGLKIGGTGENYYGYFGVMGDDQFEHHDGDYTAVRTFIDGGLGIGTIVPGPKSELNAYLVAQIEGGIENCLKIHEGTGQELCVAGSVNVVFSAFPNFAETGVAFLLQGNAGLKYNVDVTDEGRFSIEAGFTGSIAGAQQYRQPPIGLQGDGIVPTINFVFQQ